MDQVERNRILTASQQLMKRESTPAPWIDPYDDMTPEEKSKLIIELMRQQEAARLQHEEDHRQYEEYRRQYEEVHRQNEELLKRLDKMLEYQNQNVVLINLVAKMQTQLADYEAERKLSNKNRFGSKSQKIKKNKNKDKDEEPPISREQEKDGFDGTDASINSNSEVNMSDDEHKDSLSDEATKEIRAYRQGAIYETMQATKKLFHNSDLKKLPAGSVVLKTYYKSSYEQVSQIIEHNYQFVTYKTPDGKLHNEYIACDGGSTYVDVVPGTHASASFMSYLVFNKYVLDTPLYREIYRVMNEEMKVSRMTLTNWLEKGSIQIKKIIDYLKEKCLERDAIINCDETWCRVKVHTKYMKRYVWCLVNKAANIVIYCYEKGSRSRDALRHILRDRKIKALQSDGYNVYMYLDDHMIDVDHLCCMAHSRAKFVYAFEQGGDADAAYFLERIKELYELEAEYQRDKLSAEEIKKRRNSLQTKEIIIKMRSKLDALKSENHPPRGELMEKALRYLDKFWKQLFVFLKDGEYTIDNSIAERFIRPLSGERKNSLFFGSDKMAEVSACFHSILSTCKMMGISQLEYLKKFYGAIVKGRVDFENLHPAAIDLNINKQ